MCAGGDAVLSAASAVSVSRWAARPPPPRPAQRRRVCGRALTGPRSATTSIEAACGTVSFSYARGGDIQVSPHPSPVSPARAHAPPAPQCLKAPEAFTARTRSAPAASIDCGAGGGVITAIEFAAFGTPSGTCGAFVADTHCDAPGAAAVVEAACLGRAACAPPAAGAAYAPAGARCGAARALYVQARCSGGHSLAAAASLPTGGRGRVVLPGAPVPANATHAGVRGPGTVRVTEGASRAVVFAGGAPAGVLPEGVVAAAWDAAAGAVVVTLAAGSYELELTAA